VFLFNGLIGILKLTAFGLGLEKVIILNINSRSPSPHTLGLGVENGALHRNAPPVEQVAFGIHNRLPPVNRNFAPQALENLQHNQHLSVQYTDDLAPIGANPHLHAQLPQINQTVATHINGATGQSTGTTILMNRAGLTTSDNAFRTTSGQTNSNYYIMPDNLKNNI